MSNALKDIIPTWVKHHKKRWGDCQFDILYGHGGVTHQAVLKSELLKKGNHPRIFFHGEQTKDAIVLTHGLSDSPWYVEAIARRFYDEGLNVILPLLPGHGLLDPDTAMEDEMLDTKWREEIDTAVELAVKLGNRISLGGFSTGGALSCNKALRNPEAIKGGLFLYAGALSIGAFNDRLAGIGIVQKMVRQQDGKIVGVGQDPYKYPIFPKFGGTELAQIITQNQRLSEGKRITQPVFAAHSLHDETADLNGILEFLKNNVERGEAFLISQNVRHAETPLAVDVPLDFSQELAPEYEPKANPQFEEMMQASLVFYRKHIVAH